MSHFDPEEIKQISLINVKANLMGGLPEEVDYLWRFLAKEQEKRECLGTK